MNKELLNMSILEYILQKVQFHLNSKYFKSIFDYLYKNKTSIFLELLITIGLILFIIKKIYSYFSKKGIYMQQLFFDVNIVNKNIKVYEKMSKVDKLITKFVNSHNALKMKMGLKNDDKDDCFFKIAKSFLENYSKN